jgi:DNA replication protein DnaC
MNRQYDRIAYACEQLGLQAIPQSWSRIAQHQMNKEGSYADFIEALLNEEISAKQERTSYLA